MTTATSKEHELDLIELEANYSLDRELLNGIYLFLRDMGIVVNGNSRKRMDIKRTKVKEFHKKVCLDNNRFPSNVPYVDVYPEFFSFIIKTEKKAKDIGSIKNMFNSWYSEVGVEIKEQVPEDDHTDPEPVSRTPHIDKLLSGKSKSEGSDVSKWSDDMLVAQFLKIRVLYTDEMIKRNADKHTCYSTKIINEIKKRGLEDAIKQKQNV